MLQSDFETDKRAILWKPDNENDHFYLLKDKQTESLLVFVCYFWSEMIA